MTFILTAPPPGYVALAQYARGIETDPDVATRAARRGDIPGAVQAQVPLQPRPIWFVPPDCAWRPQPVGRPRHRQP